MKKYITIALCVLLLVLAAVPAFAAEETKITVTASKTVVQRGETVDFEKLHEEIILRDKQDSEREFAPLTQAKDAVVIDTSHMQIDEVVRTIKSYIQSKI